MSHVHMTHTAESGTQVPAVPPSPVPDPVPATPWAFVVLLAALVLVGSWRGGLWWRSGRSTTGSGDTE